MNLYQKIFKIKIGSWYECQHSKIYGIDIAKVISLDFSDVVLCNDKLAVRIDRKMFSRDFSLLPFREYFDDFIKIKLIQFCQWYKYKDYEGYVKPLKIRGNSVLYLCREGDKCSMSLDNFINDYKIHK